MSDIKMNAALDLCINCSQCWIH